MALPEISDGTVCLRPFAKHDTDAAVSWLSGPSSRDRSATDGGPAGDPVEAQHLANKLCHSNAYCVVLDEESCGWVSVDADGRGCGHVQVVLANPRLWNQGIGTRVMRLVQAAAFDHLALKALAVAAISETAEAARVCFEDCGFAMQARRLRPDGTGVEVDYYLDALSFRSAEQRILLVHHGRSAPEQEGLILGATVDPPLDNVGRAQAEALALSGLLYGMAECICSPLRRARATAEQAFATHDIPIALAEEWIDRNWGSLSGRSYASLERDAQGMLCDPPMGESQEEFDRRLEGALRLLPHGNHLAIVTHGAVIANLLRMLCPALAEAGGLSSGLGIAHGSLSELRRGPSGWRVIRINDDRHQRGRRATAESA